LIEGIAPNREALDLRLAGLCKIAPPELDPIEHAVLWLGLHELQSHPELPYRVALDEAVQLTKQFGATDGHKFVNAVLDRAARELRPREYGT
jgi:transcription antitermination protein NusB